MVTFFKKDLCPQAASPRTVVFSAPDLSAGHCQPTPSPATPGHSQQVWLSLLWGHCSFSWCTQGFIVPSKSLFSWRFSVFLHIPRFGKSVVGSRTFVTIWELLLYNCSFVCGLSAQWLYSVANGDLLQWTYATSCTSQACCSQGPCPPAGPCWPVSPQETLKHSKAGLAQSLVGVTFPFCWSWYTQGLVCAVWAFLVVSTIIRWIKGSHYQHYRENIYYK